MWPAPTTTTTRRSKDNSRVRSEIDSHDGVALGAAREVEAAQQVLKAERPVEQPGGRLGIGRGQDSVPRVGARQHVVEQVAAQARALVFGQDVKLRKLEAVAQPALRPVPAECLG